MYGFQVYDESFVEVLLDLFAIGEVFLLVAVNCEFVVREVFFLSTEDNFCMISCPVVDVVL